MCIISANLIKRILQVFIPILSFFTIINFDIYRIELQIVYTTQCEYVTLWTISFILLHNNLIWENMFQSIYRVKNATPWI